VKRVQTRGVRLFFKVVAGTGRSQAPTMVLRPGQATGGEDNVHPRSDQWLRAAGDRQRLLAPGLL